MTRRTTIQTSHVRADPPPRFFIRERHPLAVDGANAAPHGRIIGRADTADGAVADAIIEARERGDELEVCARSVADADPERPARVIARVHPGGEVCRP